MLIHWWNLHIESTKQFAPWFFFWSLLLLTLFLEILYLLLLSLLFYIYYYCDTILGKFLLKKKENTVSKYSILLTYKVLISFIFLRKFIWAFVIHIYVYEYVEACNIIIIYMLRTEYIHKTTENQIIIF